MALERREVIDRCSIAGAAIGAIFSAFVVVWFFRHFAEDMRQSINDYFLAIAIALALVVSPYVVATISQVLSRTTRASTVNLVLVVIFVASSAFLYSFGLQPHQDGEFAFVFVLGIPQLVVAAIGLAYVFFDRKRAI